MSTILLWIGVILIVAVIAWLMDKKRRKWLLSFYRNL